MTKDSRNAILFFLATFAWTWACYFPIAISGHSPYALPWLVLFIAGGMGPSLMGVLMVLMTYPQDRRRDFWRRCFSLRRISLTWWLVILLIFPAILGLASAVDIALGGALPGAEQLKALVAQPALWPLVAFISFMSGPWSEEFGWRGYALDPLLKRFGRIPGTVILGTVWGLWHLPLYFMPATWHGQMGFRPEGFWTFMLFSIGLALVMTWVYSQTNRSILTGMLLHFTSNFTAQLVAPLSGRVEILRMVMVLALGCLASVLVERRTQPGPVRATVNVLTPPTH